jgi:hypothetical protein
VQSYASSTGTYTFDADNSGVYTLEFVGVVPEFGVSGQTMTLTWADQFGTPITGSYTQQVYDPTLTTSSSASTSSFPIVVDASAGGGGTNGNGIAGSIRISGGTYWRGFQASLSYIGGGGYTTTQTQGILSNAVGFGSSTLTLTCSSTFQTSSLSLWRLS